MAPRPRIGQRVAQTGLVAVSLVLVAVGAAVGQQSEHRLSVTPMAGNTLFLSNLAPPVTLDSLETSVSTGLENQFSPGLRVGISLSEHVTVEAGLLFAATEVALDPEIGTPVGFDTDVLIFGVGGHYRVLPTADVSPYVAGGVGGKRVEIAILDPDGDTDFMWNVGVGAVFDTGWVADVQVEVRDYVSEFGDQGAEESQLQHDLWAGVGLEFGLF